jgi:hypothetical protein
VASGPPELLERARCARSAALERRAGGGGAAAARNAPGGPCMSSLTESFVSRRRTLAALTER